MSYNGIGLQTARGSGTSGYVQRSALSESKKEHITGHRQKRQNEKAKEEKCAKEVAIAKEKNKAQEEIRDHGRKRRIDAACMQLRDDMEDASEDEEVIKKAINELRTKLSEHERAVDAHKREKDSVEIVGSVGKLDLKRHRPDDTDTASSEESDTKVASGEDVKTPSKKNVIVDTKRSKAESSDITNSVYGYVRRYDERR